MSSHCAQANLGQMSSQTEVCFTAVTDVHVLLGKFGLFFSLFRFQDIRQYNFAATRWAIIDMKKHKKN